MRRIREQYKVEDIRIQINKNWRFLHFENRKKKKNVNIKWALAYSHNARLSTNAHNSFFSWLFVGEVG